MSQPFLQITVKVPLPDGAIAQAKALTDLSGAVETFKKALPKNHTFEDRVMVPRGPSGPRKPRANTAPSHEPEREAAE